MRSRSCRVSGLVINAFFSPIAGLVCPATLFAGSVRTAIHPFFAIRHALSSVRQTPRGRRALYRTRSAENAFAVIHSYYAHNICAMYIMQSGDAVPYIRVRLLYYASSKKSSRSTPFRRDVCERFVYHHPDSFLPSGFHRYSQIALYRPSIFVKKIFFVRKNFLLPDCFYMFQHMRSSKRADIRRACHAASPSIRPLYPVFV